MTAQKLIKLLRDFSKLDGQENVSVWAFDPDTGAEQQVSGIIYDPDNKALTLQTDDPD